MKTSVHVLATVALSAMMLGGCSESITEGYGAFVKGPSGPYGEIQPVASYADHVSLAKYGRIELGEITDGYAGRVPSPFFSDMIAEFPKALNKYKIPSGSGNQTLLVRGKVLYIELNQSKLGYVLGEVEEAVAEIQLVDKATGKVLGRAICVGRTTERLNFGIAKKAEGVSRAIAAWIASYMPKKSKE